MNDPKVAGAYGEWKDYNAYSDFHLQCRVVPVFLCPGRPCVRPFGQEGTGQVVVDFTPEPLTQDVSFVFHIEKIGRRGSGPALRRNLRHTIHHGTDHGTDSGPKDLQTVVQADIRRPAFSGRQRLGGNVAL